MQLHLQLGALAEQSNLPVRGAILAMDLFEGKIRRFNGYEPNPILYEGLKKRAQTIWQAVGGDVEPATEPGPLCGWCTYISDCPAFAAEECPELTEEVLALARLKAEKKGLQEEYDLRARDLLKIVEERGAFKSGGHLVRKRRRNVTSTDFSAVDEALRELGRSLGEFQSTKPGNAWLDLVAVK
jgi:CRISPR-associated exonuclease Cas4